MYVFFFCRLIVMCCACVYISLLFYLVVCFRQKFEVFFFLKPMFDHSVLLIPFDKIDHIFFRLVRRLVCLAYSFVTSQINIFVAKPSFVFDSKTFFFHLSRAQFCVIQSTPQIRSNLVDCFFLYVIYYREISGSHSSRSYKSIVSRN